MPRPGGATRAHILEVANELFAQQGYDATSLRQIADRVGVTKAALYYHFSSKEELLVALLEPLRGILGEMLDRLDAADSVAAWGDVMDWVIDSMLELSPFFTLVSSNRNVVEQVLESSLFGKDHDQVHRRIDRALMAASDDLTERIRMAAALGAVAAFDDFAPTLLTSTPPEDLRRELRAAVRELLALDER